MADTTYSYGPQRIIYVAADFTEGATVTATLYDRLLQEVPDSPFALVEFKDGLYYFDYDFEELGMYHGCFFEDGNITLYHAYRIVRH